MKEEDADFDGRMRVQIFGASDDQVLVRKVRTEAAKEPDVRVEDVGGEEVLVGEESDEVITDEDGEVVTKEEMFDVKSYLAMRPVEFNIADTLSIKIEFDNDRKRWNITATPWTKVYEVAGDTSIERSSLPDDWQLQYQKVPDDVRLTDPYGGLCLAIDLPEEEWEIEKVD